MRKTALLALFCLSALLAFSRQSSVKGFVKDTIENRQLAFAVVSLLRGSDSVLVQFTRTNENGEFRIEGMPAGDYVLMITYPKFADLAEKIQLKENSPLNLGVLALTPASVLMKEVVVRVNNSMRMKGDTTEFTADSFKLREGATVEELLQKLPGLTVNSKGEITAQGKRVDKVLVDGEEFFGEDPTIATQNIGAKAVDKVQVFDTKTEQDQLKGIGASGDAGKTINIKLKESAKKGYFGKLEAGSNFNNLHDGKIMFNRFKGAQKLSVYGTKSNTNTGSLGWEDRNKMGIEEDYEFDEISGFYYSYGDGDDEFNDWNLRGLPNAYTAGALYSDKFNEDIHKVNLSYLYNRLGTTNRSSDISQTILKDSSVFRNSLSNSRGLSQQHAIRGKYEWKIDSLASIKFTISGSQREKDMTTDFISNSLNDDQEFINRNDRTNSVYSKRKKLDNVLTYKQLFRKKNRQLLTTLRLGLVDDNSNESLFSRTEFYTSGNLDSVVLIDQQKINTGESRTIGAKITYNEPITDKLNIVAEYSLNHNKSESFRNSFEKDGDDKYTVRNPLNSNNFNLDALSNSGTITARYLGKKIRMAAGAGISAIRLNLDNLDQASKTRYNFVGFTPQAQIAYMKSQQSQISLNYRGNTVQPNLNQLQPLQNNNDPLSIYMGNPDLKVGFNHNVSLNFNDYKVLSGRYIFGNVGINFNQNAITNSSQFNPQTGERTYMPVNVNGNYNWYMWSAINSGRAEKKWQHEISPQANGGRNVNFLNGERNVNTYTTLSLSYSLSYDVQDKYNIRIGPSASRNLSKSSLNPDAQNNYWTYGGRVNGWVKLPAKFELQTDVEMNLRQKTRAFPDNANVTVWNARLTRKFLKDNSFRLELYAYDILNQNIGFTRTINSNFVNEQRYDRISQYFMLKAVWTFNKMPGAEK
ncbi:MAG: outer membrane beta-barrel protein [Chitinophagaceae bacterium]